jgi:hypothetical protein
MSSFGTTKRERKSTSHNIGKAFQDFFVFVGTALPRIVNWITGDHGGQILLGGLMIFFLAVNVESYWQSISDEVFIPKWGVRDGANLGTIVRLIFLPNFWMTVGFVLAINSISALFFRDVAISVARKRYQSVAEEKMPAPPSLNSLKIASVRYRQLKSAGMKGVRLAGVGALFCLTVDVVSNYSGFPWLTASSGKLVLFTWWICSTFGFEVCGAIMNNKALRSGTTTNE